MLQAAIAECGKKGKSRWIHIAIEELFESDPILQSVGQGEDLNVNDATDVINITPELRDRIETAILKLRRQDPLMEGVQSAIIRAAIRQKLGSDFL